MVSEAAPSYNERETCNHSNRHLIFGDPHTVDKGDVAPKVPNKLKIPFLGICIYKYMRWVSPN